MTIGIKADKKNTLVPNYASLKNTVYFILLFYKNINFYQNLIIKNRLTNSEGQKYFLIIFAVPF